MNHRKYGDNVAPKCGPRPQAQAGGCGARHGGGDRGQGNRIRHLGCSPTHAHN